MFIFGLVVAAGLYLVWSSDGDSGDSLASPDFGLPVVDSDVAALTQVVLDGEARAVVVFSESLSDGIGEVDGASIEVCAALAESLALAGTPQEVFDAALIVPDELLADALLNLHAATQTLFAMCRGDDDAAVVAAADTAMELLLVVQARMSQVEAAS